MAELEQACGERALLRSLREDLFSSVGSSGFSEGP
jgi:hypothetical protein